MDDVKVSWIETSNEVYAMQRRNLYPFLSKLGMEGWMEDDGTLKIRWFGASIGIKRVGVAAWEVYDVHQYEPSGPKFLILDLFTMVIEKEYRGTGIGRKLFLESLAQATAALDMRGYVVGALQIETHGADGFYKKVLASLGYEYRTETREMVSGHPITVFWVPLKRL